MAEEMMTTTETTKQWSKIASKFLSLERSTMAMARISAAGKRQCVNSANFLCKAEN